MFDRLNLRQQLGSRLGQVLTPEIAAELELSILYGPDNSVDTTKFGSKDYKGLTFSAERFADIVEEIHPLHEAHFQETEKHRLGFGLDLDYELYKAYERRGEMIQFT